MPGDAFSRARVVPHPRAIEPEPAEVMLRFTEETPAAVRVDIRPETDAATVARLLADLVRSIRTNPAMLARCREDRT